MGRSTRTAKGQEKDLWETADSLLMELANRVWPGAKQESFPEIGFN
ncbi:MAG: hypothetical protein GWP61_01795 [Chloroflexi bacterium]|jgi:hypothetical protein|nr:hypothetical protein [Chloroflexota bacterium]